MRVVRKGREVRLKARVLMVLEGILLVPGPGFLDKNDVGLAVPG
jgi:hypothetical protein